MPSNSGPSNLYGGGVYGLNLYGAGYWIDITNDRFVYWYRARMWNTEPPRFMTGEELLSVTPSAYDPNGISIALTGPMQFVENISAYVGSVPLKSLEDIPAVMVKMVATVESGIDPDWAPTKFFDANLNIPIQEEETPTYSLSFG